MSDVLRPDNFDQLQDLLQSTELVLPVGRRTKPSLSTGTGATLVSLAELTGITQYEPSEFTFTARAGTPIAEVAATLARKNQYLPFDPLLVNAGATVGGTVAAGLSGPGRARYGGLRDFLLGVRFLSGDGNVIHAGGKVVKNAAGFDIPKLLVGSLGRLGVMTELTFKVFPQAQSLHTYQLTCDDHQQAMARIVAAASAKWELDAIDYQPSRRRLLLRIAGAESTNQQIAGKIRSEWSCDLQRLDDADAKTLWTSIGELSWWDGAARGDGDRGSGFDSGTSGGDPIVVKVPVTPKQFLQLAAKPSLQNGLDWHLSVAAAVLWVAADSTQSLAQLDDALTEMNVGGLVVRGCVDKIWRGVFAKSQMADGIKRAMDPAGRFPDFAEN